MKKSLIFIIVLIFIIGAGFFGFWFYRDQVFSKEVLKLEILGSDTANMGDQITYTVKYKNNGNFVLESPKLTFDLPDDSLTEDTKTRLTQNLKDIYPGQENVVIFTTRLLGKEQDIKMARASLSYVPHNLSVRYESYTTFATKINSVPIALTQDLPAKLERGQSVTYSIDYLSNIDYPLENLSIKIDATPGFKFVSSIPTSLNGVEWKLATLQRGQGGKIIIKGSVNSDASDDLHFSLHLGMWINGSFMVLKEATQDVQISGDTPAAPPEVIKDPDAHVSLSQKGYHKGSQDFENSGPIPPVVGMPTTYTVTWQIHSDIHNVKNATVTATLPQNVTLTAVSPESQIPHVLSNGVTKKLVWSVANVTADNLAVSFQLTLTPTAQQQGSTAPIIGQATILGQDEVTQNTVSATAIGVSTDLPSDAQNLGGGIVK